MGCQAGQQGDGLPQPPAHYPSAADRGGRTVTGGESAARVTRVGRTSRKPVERRRRRPRGGFGDVRQLRRDAPPHPIRRGCRQIPLLDSTGRGDDTGHPAQVVPAALAHGDVLPGTRVVGRDAVAERQLHQVCRVDMRHRHPPVRVLPGLPRPRTRRTRPKPGGGGVCREGAVPSVTAARESGGRHDGTGEPSCRVSHAGPRPGVSPARP